MKNILVIEDNKEINQILSDLLTKHNYCVFSAYNAFQGMDMFREHNIDCIITDLVLPIMSGERFIYEVRKTSNVHIIIISTKMTIEEKLEGLNVGADDFLVKPFNNDEILIKLRNLFKKKDFSKDRISLNNGDFIFDSGVTQIVVGSTPIELTAIEYFIMIILCNNLNKVLSRSQIVSQLYRNEKFVTERIVDTHIKNIRKKISQHSELLYIKTIYGLGYSLEGEKDE